LTAKDPPPSGPSPAPFRNVPPVAHARRRVGAPLDLGVRALDTFLPAAGATSLADGYRRLEEIMGVLETEN
jgi:flagellar biosynthesis/type III secretory pathway ATPase